jgi:hypothetical protein
MTAAARPRVIVSVENDGRELCVDVFERPDGSFGYESYRRDPEENHGWRSLARTAGLRFESLAEAALSARGSVPWLGEIPEWQRFERSVGD